MKREIIFILIMFLISNCIRETNTNNNKIHLKFMQWSTPEEVKLFKKSIKVFQKKHPEVELEIIYEPATGYMDKLLTMLAGNTLPDIFFVYSGNLGSLIKKDILLDLTPYIKRDYKEIDFDDFFPSALKGYTYNNHIFGLPQGIDVFALFYNKTIFDKYGVNYPDENWTWGDLLKAARELTRDIDGDGRKDIYGFLAVNWYTSFLSYIWCAGGRLFDKNGNKCLIDSKETINAFKWYFDLIKKYKVSPTRSARGDMGEAELLATGKIAMTISGHYMEKQLFGNKIRDSKWDVALIPKAKYRKIFQHSAGIVINKNTPHKELAWELLKTIVSKQGCKWNAEMGVNVPVRKSAVKVFLKRKFRPQHEEIFIKSLNYIEPFPPIMNFNIAVGRISERFDEVLLKDEKVEKICKKLKKELDEIIK